MNEQILYHVRRYLSCMVCALIVLLSMVCPVSVAGQTKIFLREKITKSASARVDIGDTIAIEVVVRFDTVKIQGVDFYVTFDNKYFSIIDQSSDTLIQPFKFTGGLFGDKWLVNDTHGDLWDTTNTIDKFQLDGSILLSAGDRTGEGVAATFYMKAIARVESSLVSIDYDRGNHRDTKLFPRQIAPASALFDFKDNMHISTGTITAVKEWTGNGLPGNFALMQNYPNPFNPETMISYSIPYPSPVTISIYNVSGQVVRSLLHRNQSAGSYEVRWDGKDDHGIAVASGIYVYTLSTNTHRMSKKMILLR